MPLFMDRHDLEAGTSADDVANAHAKDLEVQERHGVRYISYWFDYGAHAAFCLVDAPSAAKATEVHAEAHGLIPSRIIAVDPSAVESFLGRIGQKPNPGSDDMGSGFLAILFTDLEGSTAITQRHGDAAGMRVIRAHDVIVREALANRSGREVKHTGDGIMACFTSVSRAVEAAITIQRGVAEHNRTGADEGFRLKIGLSAGEPVAEGTDLFGAAVQLASRLCDAAGPDRIFVSSPIRELAIGKGLPFADVGEVDLKGFPEPVRVAEVRWNDATAAD